MAGAAARLKPSSRSNGAAAQRAAEPVRLGALEGYIGFHLRIAQAASFQAFAREVGDSDLRPGRFAILYLMLPVAVMALFSLNDPPGKSNVSWHGFSLDAWLLHAEFPNARSAVINVTATTTRRRFPSVGISGRADRENSCACRLRCRRFVAMRPPRAEFSSAMIHLVITSASRHHLIREHTIRPAHAPRDLRSAVGKQGLRFGWTLSMPVRWYVVDNQRREFLYSAHADRTRSEALRLPCSTGVVAGGGLQASAAAFASNVTGSPLKAAFPLIVSR